jgi:hypothetical protein
MPREKTIVAFARRMRFREVAVKRNASSDLLARRLKQRLNVIDVKVLGYDNAKAWLAR